MDPDATLDNIRLSIADYQRYGMSLGQDPFDRFFEAVDELNKWITKLTEASRPVIGDDLNFTHTGRKDINAKDS